MVIILILLKLFLSIRILYLYTQSLDDAMFTKLFSYNQQKIDQGDRLIPLKLTELNLKMWNNFNKETLEKFKSQYPNWQVIDYYGEDI